MSASTEANHTNPPPPEPPSSAGPLDNLLYLLIHRTDDVSEWLDALNERITDPGLALGKIGEIIRLGTKAGVDEAVTRKVVVAIVAADQLGWKDDKIDFLVTGIYQEHREREEDDRRRRAGLPPLR